MGYPKWKYRKHPVLGCFQATLVADAATESTLDPDWSDDATTTGFAVRPASQINPAHITESTLFEVITDNTGTPVTAAIALTTAGDING